MKVLILTVVFILSSFSTQVNAAPECDSSGSYGRRVYLLKKMGVTLKKYHETEGTAPHPVFDKIETAIFLKNVRNEDHAALLANSICNQYFDR